MALFKISKGNASALGNQPKTEGYCWFTPDDGKFYIDVSDTTRQILNAGHADTAEKDASGNIITETYETKADANSKLTESKTYTDQKLATKADASNIPTKLSDLEDDENHRTVTDTDKNIWNLKSQVQLIKSDNAKILSTLNIHKLTQEEYDQKVSDGTLDDDAIYLTPDEDDIDLSPYATIEQLNTKVDIAALSNYYTKTEIESFELITVEDIDNICGATINIQMIGGNEVKF